MDTDLINDPLFDLSIILIQRLGEIPDSRLPELRDLCMRVFLTGLRVSEKAVEIELDSVELGLNRGLKDAYLELADLSTEAAAAIVDFETFLKDFVH